jgi:hypothetical protein
MEKGEKLEAGVAIETHSLRGEKAGPIKGATRYAVIQNIAGVPPIRGRNPEARARDGLAWPAEEANTVPLHHPPRHRQ